MAKIALRVYNREIENLIDLGQTDEAIGHCKAILKIYPKHLETYRLLGKAYLESHRYSEALDIFQRVLSVMPDDFLAHIGMSIIREDEGNLDAAIWHMERAFEVQPSNSAIQDELRRLYGRRDGVQPPKIRLTRGALVRMYANGELFAQAIAEARAALSEDPQRIDLEVLLARLYYLSGQQIETTEICSRLINKLPFCYDANKILAEILLSTTKSEDAKIYQERVCALDPYLAMVSPATPTIAQIPDMAVNLDRLDWQTPREGSTTQPEWASAIGMNLEEEDKITPEWMMPSTDEVVSGNTASSDIAVEDFSPLSDAFQEEAQQLIPASIVEEVNSQVVETDDAFPDWMRSAGWTASEEKPSNQELPGDENAFTEAIEAEELPDWLKDLTPATSETLQQSEQIVEEKQTILPEGETILPVENLLQPESFEEAEVTETSDVEESSSFIQAPVETRLEEQPEDVIRLEVPQNENEKILSSAENEMPFEEETPSEDTLPDWLKITPLGEIQGEDILEVESTSTSEQVLDEVGLETSSVADWLRELGEKELEGENKQDGIEEQDLPEWLRVKVEAEPEHPVLFEAIQEGDQVESFLQKPGETVEEPVFLEMPSAPEDVLPESPETTIPAEEEVKLSDDDATFAWLESLAVKQGVDEQTLLTTEEERAEQANRMILLEAEEKIDMEVPSLEEEKEIGVEPIPEWAKETIETEAVPDEQLFSQIGEAEETIKSVSEENAVTQEVELTTPVSEQSALELFATVSETEGIAEETILPMDLLSVEEERISEISTESEVESINVQEEIIPEIHPVEDETSEANLLDLARSTFKHGQIEESVEIYQQMIQSGENIAEVIEDLTADTYSHPVEFSIYQTLGDAYRKNNQLQEALDAYTKAEELF